MYTSNIQYTYTNMCIYIEISSSFTRSRKTLKNELAKEGVVDSHPDFLQWRKQLLTNILSSIWSV